MAWRLATLNPSGRHAPRAAGLAPPDCLACHPGTHTKWVAARDGRITGFRTVMTGELFALLKEHSILASRMRAEPAPGPDFDAGLRAVYYVRVLEIPTPRWTAYDAKRFNVKMPKDVRMVTQERAYTSPIWYTPSG